ncbi:hypothetical protein MRS76_04645 [Rhizobiaceae bacterium n13]|uniref:Uncharacterized protein n=1 Tax=Ferirhizobium litorale TaxID=2927786 RepID=A0AAE3QCJ8_9HYPH|nr:hypothetical protein [Fererhizobium litorale]MDI7861236.1 hypothetical protein [Fererhizobium litorale]MDI7921383.1 hypothetical protein [Fererhizobium litorale]
MLQHTGTATTPLKSRSLMASVSDFVFQIGAAVNAAAEYRRAYCQDRGRPHYQTPAQRAAAGIPL